MHLQANALQRTDSYHGLRCLLNRAARYPGRLLGLSFLAESYMTFCKVCFWMSPISCVYKTFEIPQGLQRIPLPFRKGSAKRILISSFHIQNRTCVRYLLAGPGVWLCPLCDPLGNVHSPHWLKWTNISGTLGVTVNIAIKRRKMAAV